jgi:hypothetical protein
MTTPEDPNNIADALDRFPSDAYRYEDTVHETVDHADQRDEYDRIRATAARLLRESAGTADRLATAGAEHDKVVNWADAALDRRNQKIAELTAERDAAEARLAALLDAIGDPRRVRSMTVTLHPGKSWYPTGPWMLRIADAAAAAREDQ